jgi:hypothetical protein
MSDEDKKYLNYQEAGIPRLIIGNVQKKIDSVGERVSRFFSELSAIGGDEHAIADIVSGHQDATRCAQAAETPAPQFRKPSISTRFGTIMRDLGLCGDTKDYDEDK